MAKQSVATAETPKARIERLQGEDIGFSGLMSILSRRTQERGNPVAKLTDEELVTTANQCSNIKAAASNGIEVVGKLISSYDKNAGDFDNNSVGWLVTHLNEVLSQAAEFEWCATNELNSRGYDVLGEPTGQSRSETTLRAVNS